MEEVNFETSEKPRSHHRGKKNLFWCPLFMLMALKPYVESCLRAGSKGIVVEEVQSVCPVGAVSNGGVCVQGES